LLCVVWTHTKMRLIY